MAADLGRRGGKKRKNVRMEGVRITRGTAVSALARGSRRFSREECCLADATLLILSSCHDVNSNTPSLDLRMMTDSVRS